jgi:D-aminoacyl-tRNA deacylase
MRAAIVCSDVDDASQNIARQLLKRARWTRCSDDRILWTYQNLQLLITEDKLIELEGVDKQLDAEVLVFASRHQSERRKGPIFTAHFTGDLERSFNATPSIALARAAPAALKFVLQTLQHSSTVEVLVEATHHGPCSIDTPSLFVEIGSSKTEWTNVVLGDTIARALLDLNSASLSSLCPTAVGFGGPHYAVRHTAVILETDICFGHIFSTYQLGQLTEPVIEAAFEKSQAHFAYFDRKHMGSDRRRIESLVNDLGYEVLRTGDLEKPKDVSWQLWLSIRHALRSCGYAAQRERINLSAALRDALKQSWRDRGLKLTRVGLNPILIRRVQAINNEAFMQLIETEKVVYLERKDGIICAIFIVAGRSAQRVQTALVEGAVRILKQRYEVEYSQQKSKLYISERKFNARLARSLGVTDGPLFAKLARGEPIKINSKVIKPEDVFTKVRTAFDLVSADKSNWH